MEQVNFFFWTDLDVLPQLILGFLTIFFLVVVYAIAQDFYERRGRWKTNHSKQSKQTMKEFMKEQEELDNWAEEQVTLLNEELNEEAELKIAKTVEAEVGLKLTYNQRTAIRMFQQNKPSIDFTIFCNQNLSVQEREEVFDLIQQEQV
jgi:hypothetical protein